MSEKLIYTIGTSNRSIDEFIEILKKYQIKKAIDVRSFPKSKKFPHFNSERLIEALEKEGIGYFYLGDKLGGFRKGGYENYTKTEEFKRGIEALEELAENSLSVFFCAEKLFFRCHRRFISEVLTQRGWKVIHIVEKERIYEHKKIVLDQKCFEFER
ncbi:DUF488 domain-containing protein [Thermodesulfovibrio yellowstonii]|uniref:DUF488 domain-containing protein n=1 Tax=Thermodesulfovibrio yellowstonii TaxID=28262 RepID=A0A9W6LKC7_9BACT|nr:DUF488 domain-containing protein [Thermodesulfovibrio islandicus]GLI54106.1 hypothetical protein TISLANDTSLP1_17990 [Thermodesulfovibrio islandicus]